MESPLRLPLRLCGFALREIEGQCDPATEPEPKRRSRVTANLPKLGVDIADRRVQNDHNSDTSPMSAIGRAGGLRGGRARADKLPKERRAEIARQAAAAQ